MVMKLAKHFLKISYLYSKSQEAGETSQTDGLPTVKPKVVLFKQTCFFGGKLTYVRTHCVRCINTSKAWSSIGLLLASSGQASMLSGTHIDEVKTVIEK